MISILTDVTKCIGCYRCVQACAEANRLGEDIPEYQDVPDGLTDRRWTSIIARPGKHYVRKHCQHCLEPACVSVCPVGAMQKTPEGAVIYDRNLCMGCRYCMMACPYGIPRYQWERTAPLVRKCTFCYERLKKGALPACVEICPEGATIFGERDELLAEAKRRLQAEPERYIQKVYGEHEVGGTAVLYVSDIPLDFLGIEGRISGQPLPKEPLPALTWKVLEKVPAVALGMGVFMLGTYWIIERRMKIAAEQGSVPAEERASEEGSGE